jgi:hypothetical protein
VRGAARDHDQIPVAVRQPAEGALQDAGSACDEDQFVGAAIPVEAGRCSRGPAHGIENVVVAEQRDAAGAAIPGRDELICPEEHVVGNTVVELGLSRAAVTHMPDPGGRVEPVERRRGSAEALAAHQLFVVVPAALTFQDRVPPRGEHALALVKRHLSFLQSRVRIPQRRALSARLRAWTEPGRRRY